jgi:hypothetical protein
MFDNIAGAIREYTEVYKEALAIERLKLEADNEKTREIRRVADGIEALIERMFHTVR